MSSRTYVARYRCMYIVCNAHVCESVCINTHDVTVDTTKLPVCVI